MLILQMTQLKGDMYAFDNYKEMVKKNMAQYK